MLGYPIRRLGDVSITSAQTKTEPAIVGLGGMSVVTALARFTYGSGGTSVDAYIQTSLDQGSTWLDIIRFSFTTSSQTRILAIRSGSIITPYIPTDGSLSSDVLDPAPLGDRLRLKVVSTGVYAGGTLLAVRVMVT